MRQISTGRGVTCMPRYLNEEVTGIGQEGTMFCEVILSSSISADLSQFMSRPQNSPKLVIILIAVSRECLVSSNSSMVSSE